MFKPSCNITIELKDSGTKEKVELKTEKGTETLLLYVPQDPVAGTVRIEVPTGKTLDHEGIKVELIGQIGTFLSFEFFIILVHYCCFSI